MKNKTNKNNYSDKFNFSYNLIHLAYRLFDRETRSGFKELKQKAKQLYNYGNKYCYDENFKSIKGIKNLNKKMEELEHIANGDFY
jgi:hypothetical protein